MSHKIPRILSVGHWHVLSTSLPLPSASASGNPNAQLNNAHRRCPFIYCSSLDRTYMPECQITTSLFTASTHVPWQLAVSTVSRVRNPRHARPGSKVKFARY